MRSNLEGKISVVVGGFSKVGQAIVDRLSAERSVVIAVDEGLAVSAEAASLRAIKRHLLEDLTDVHEVQSTLKQIESTYGKIDILVMAVDFRENSFRANEAGKLKSLLIKNVLPVQLFCHFTVPIMKKRKFGRIIIVNSLKYLGAPRSFGYATAKSALFGLTRALALDVVKDGITVNCVVVGELEELVCVANSEREALLKRIPVGKIGSVNDVGYAVRFLASAESGYITGQLLFVCGGEHIHVSMSA
ncbi:hypothetical protein DRN75_01625 [Nanoarchaeota archaeon]|nr:MAG: hypothetical protein DRN75_01625 [Nanoarchaeota archaeon]